MGKFNSADRGLVRTLPEYPKWKKRLKKDDLTLSLLEIFRGVSLAGC